jgi:predicted permease
MYATVDRLLFRPPDGIREPDRVVRLYNDRWISFLPDRATQRSFTYPDAMEQRSVAGFADVALYNDTRKYTIGRGADAARYDGVLATASFWTVLGARPQLGRLFTAEEDVRGGAAVVVISDGLWRRAYGGARDVLGKTIDFGHGPYEIIGVTERGFTGADLKPVDFWMPLHVAGFPVQGDAWVDSRGWWWLRAIARLAPGVSAEAAEPAASLAYNNSRREFVERGDERPDARIIAASLIAARGPDPAQESIVAKWLAGVSLLVLLIACANVANLLLARTIRQRRETGIRLALGISRGRLIGQMLAEGLLLAALGAVAALAVTYWGGGFVQRTLLPEVEWGPAVTSRVVVFVLVVTALAGVVSALVPALHATRSGVAGALREASGGVTRSASTVRTTLSLVQASLSVILLVGAGLFVRSLQRVEAVDLGFDARNVVVARPQFDATGVSDADRSAYFDRALTRLDAIPGVRAVASAQTLPFFNSMAVLLRAEGVDTLPRPTSGGPYIYPVSTDYFEALGLRIRRGRAFEATDVLGAPRVAIVNESMAKAIWPADDAIDKCLYVRDVPSDPEVCSRIVGIVADPHRQSVREDAQLLYWVPLEQDVIHQPPGSLAIRVSGEMAPVLAAIRRELLALDPRVRFANALPFQEQIDPQLQSWKLGATMFTLFGVLALVVAAIGLFSVLSFDVAQRTREIGLRGALGASRRSIVRIFLGRALALTTGGTVVGLLIALLLSPRIEDLLFDTSPRDALTIALVTATLLLVAVVASGIPAWRAANVDPNLALRAD